MSKNVKAEFLKGGRIRLIRPFEDVPRGFICDGASVPRFFWRLLGHPFDNHHLKPGIRHDYGYAKGKVPRKVLDKRYRDDLKEEGLGLIRRNLEYFGVRVFGRRHYNTNNTKEKETQMKPSQIIKSLAFAALAFSFSGCQTVIKAEKHPEQVLPIEEKVSVNGEERIIVRDYKIASGGWDASARSPLWATESLKGLDIGVQTNSTVYLRLDTYNRDLSTNAVILTEKTFEGATNLAAKIGAAIATSGTSAGADAVSAAAKALYEKFTAAGGNVENATVECKDGVCTVTDGNVSCTDGSCSDKN